MTLKDVLEHLSELALRIRPGDLRVCGEMLRLLESVEHSATDEECLFLKGCLEGMILGELDGGGPDPEQIRDAVEMLRRRALDAPNRARPSSHDSGTPADAAPAPVTDEDAGVLTEFIAEAYEHLQSIELRMVDWEKNPGDHEIINSIFRPFHTIKGISGFLNLAEINRVSHLLESVLDEARNGKVTVDHALSDLIFDGVDAMRLMLASLERAARSGQPVTSGIHVESLIGRLETFLEKGGAASRSVRPEAVRNASLPAGLLDALIAGEGAAAPGGDGDIPEPGSAPDERYIRISAGKMDQLADMVDELVIVQNMVTQNPEMACINDPRLIGDIAQLRRVTAALLAISMSMRLVQVEATFQKMNRIVRDIARKTGKRISLMIEGQTAEIDRSIVDELHDPLVHMIRNACDHGIGTPDQRRAHGKPEEGTILLKAEHEGGHVVITVSDDGRGIDREAIRKKAVERGLIAAGEFPDEHAIDSMIFIPGLSTTGKITELSGRGVGMDVVKKTLEKLRGTIEISTARGMGTTFTIKLPLTTASGSKTWR